jgi:6-phosphogluconate dehydrogenase
MDIGFCGLGKMGANMVRRLLRHGHRLVVWNRTYARAQQMAAEGAEPARTLADLVGALARPRVVWLMVPSAAVEDLLAELTPLLEAGDVVVDGANSNFHDSVRRQAELAQRGIRFADVGTSGGIWGLHYGYNLMVGGDPETFRTIEPALHSLAPPGGYLHLGRAGAGHFAKMVHNGIEYGLLQAYGEGFEILRASDFDFDLLKVAHLWNQGSVIRSWLLELAEGALARDPGLASIQGYVEDSGEGRWTVLEAIARSVPAPVITLSLMARFASRQPDSFSARFVAALRQEFGGHEVRSAAPAGG